MSVARNLHRNSERVSWGAAIRGTEFTKDRRPALRCANMDSALLG